MRDVHNTSSRLVVNLILGILVVMAAETMSDQVDNYDVVVVGGGIAGVAATHHLSNTNLKVLLIEARDRIGGRILTEYRSDSDGNLIPLELGAQWIHGGMEANPLYNLAVRRNLLGPKPKVIDETLEEQYNGYFLYPNGEVIDDYYKDIAVGIMKEMEDSVWYRFADKEEDRGNLKEYLDNLANKKVEETDLDLSEDEKQMILNVVDKLATDLSVYLGGDLRNGGTTPYGCGVDLPGGDVVVPGGVYSIIQTLLDDIDKSTGKPEIMLNTTVSCINRTDPRNINIVSEDGVDIATAKHVIVALPLYVLKTESTYILPSMKSEKYDAMSNMNAGQLSKIFLEWETPWWTKDNGHLHFVHIIPDFTRDDHPYWTQTITELLEVEGQPNMLLCWVPGSGAWMVDEESDDVVIQEITELIRYFTGDPTLPSPKAIHRHKWSSDPLTNGAYSYPTPASSYKDYDTLLEPETDDDDDHPSILLAGEYTHPKFWSFMHGAYLTGIMQAQKIMDYTRNQTMDN